MVAMQEFERRGTEKAARLILHGYEAGVTDGSQCTRCEAVLRSAYLVSRGGEQANERLCPRCHSFLKAAYGSCYASRIEAGGPGRPADHR
jgi:hypothetical protein